MVRANDAAGTSSPRPFTRDGYRDLLERALGAGYEFAAFDSGDGVPGRCLLRHDVDVELGAALELARIEAELGVSSTYFVMLRSAFYNLFGRDNHDAVHALVGLGHRIGLHYDAAYKPPGEVTRSHAASIELEAAFLESMFSIPVRTVSFHQPSFGPDPGEMHPRGLVSAWNMPGYAYVSDANKSEGMSRTEELLASGLRPAFQLLVHPIWWATDDPTATTEELFDRAMLANLEREQEQILAVERAFGARRSFTIAREEP